MKILYGLEKDGMDVGVNYMAEIQKTITLDLKVQLTENDIFNWLGMCIKPETLKHLGRYALSCANCIEHPDGDDFRSLA